MEYLADHPPAHIILAAVHLKRTSGKTSRAERQTVHDLRNEMTRFGLGGPPTAKLPEIYRNQES